MNTKKADKMRRLLLAEFALIQAARFQYPSDTVKQRLCFLQAARINGTLRGMLNVEIMVNW